MNLGQAITAGQARQDKLFAELEPYMSLSLNELAVAHSEAMLAAIQASSDEELMVHERVIVLMETAGKILALEEQLLVAERPEHMDS